MESPVPVGAQVHWSIEVPARSKHRATKTEFSGCVRYCEYREIGYFIGVEFEMVEHFVPAAASARSQASPPALACLRPRAAFPHPERPALSEDEHLFILEALKPAQYHHAWLLQTRGEAQFCGF
jgi:hypothetical protein